jgi:hypothetical protein
MAAADYAKGYGEPPPDLVMGWRLKQWRALPFSGGLFDQPLQMMSRMEAALNTYDAFSARLRTKAPEFTEQYPEWALFCAEVDRWD